MKKSFLATVFFIVAFLAAACGFRGNGGELLDPYVTPTPTPFATPTPIQRATGPVAFSLEDNFYSQTQKLSLSAEGATKIYYTTDGSTPTESSREFKDEIPLTAFASVKVYCITAVAVYEDGTFSEPVVRNYFLGNEVEKRFDTLVISITTDPKNLFDYETGIFVKGKIYDEYVKAHPRAQINGGTPANYNQLRGMDGEREARLEIFDSDGTLVLEQNCGIRTYGGWSRANAMKSVKLLARKEYGDKTFDYPFFTTALDENNNVIDSFKRIVVRGHGNDNGRAFLREELFQVLAGEAGYLSKSCRPCAMYINGAYYGCYWVEENWHKSYFANHYGEVEGSLEILEGEEKKLTTEDEESQYAADDFNAMYKKYAYTDLRDDAVYEELCKELDVKGFLEVYAFRIFLGDNDWPHNNYKAFKYYAAPGEHFTEGPYDGRWHILLHDMDYSTGIYNESTSSRNLNTFLGSMDGIKSNVSPLFGRLMQRTDCKEMFITKMLELINGVFSKSHFNTTIDAMNEWRSHEQHYTYKSGKIDNWVKEDQLAGNISQLKNWIEKRCTFMIPHVYTFFKVEGGRYELKVTVPEGSEVSIGNWTVTEDFKGTYYHAYDVTLTALGGINGKIVAWTVNGERVEGEKLVLNLENMTESTCEVTPIFER